MCETTELENREWFHGSSCPEDGLQSRRISFPARTVTAREFACQFMIKIIIFHLLNCIDIVHNRLI